MRQRRSELILYGYYVCLAMTVNLILAKLWNWGFSRRELALYLLLFCGCLWICQIFGKGVWIPVWTAVWGVCLAGRFVFHFSWMCAAVSFFTASLCYFMEIEMKMGGWILLFMAAGLCVGRFLGIELEGGEFICLFLNYVGSRVYRASEPESQREVQNEDQNESRVSEMGLALGLVCFGASLWVAGSIPQQYLKELMNIPVRLQQQIRQELAGNGLIPRDAGIISRDNLLPTGQERLEVTVQQIPEEPIYLKNYTAGDYLGNRWEAADEMDFYEWLRGQDKFGSPMYYYAIYPDRFERRQYESVSYRQWEDWVNERGPGWDLKIEREYRSWSGVQRMLIREGVLSAFCYGGCSFVPAVWHTGPLRCRIRGFAGGIFSSGGRKFPGSTDRRTGPRLGGNLCGRSRLDSCRDDSAGRGDTADRDDGPGR